MRTSAGTQADGLGGQAESLRTRAKTQIDATKSGGPDGAFLDAQEKALRQAADSQLSPLEAQVGAL